VQEGTAAFGEIGLTGRLRVATQAERRLEECAKFGISAVLVPAGTRAKAKLARREAEPLRAAVSAGLDTSAKTPS